MYSVGESIQYTMGLAMLWVHNGISCYGNFIYEYSQLNFEEKQEQEDPDGPISLT